MYINKPSVTRLKQSTALIFCIVLAAGLNSTNLENLVKCLYLCADMRHFMTVTKKTVAFRHSLIKFQDISKIYFKSTLHVASGSS